MKSQNVSSVIAHDFVRGSMAYTPYMIAKAESANLYDTPEMDASIYRMLDGVTSLDGTEFKAGLEDIGRAITLNPVSKVTQAKVYDGRGIAHSKQRDADQRAKKQGSILTTHHEASQLVSQLKKEHAQQASTAENEAEEGSYTKDRSQVSASEVPLTPNTMAKDSDGWQRLQIASRDAQIDDKNPPSNATIH